MKLVYTKITMDDLKSGEEILKILEAPVTKKNVAQLKVFVEELGEMFEEQYNEMLCRMVNTSLARYHTECDCGKRIVVDVYSDIFDDKMIKC